MKECYEVFEIIDIDDFSPWFGVPIAFSKDGFYKRPTLVEYCGMLRSYWLDMNVKNSISIPTNNHLYRPKMTQNLEY